MTVDLTLLGNRIEAVITELRDLQLRFTSSEHRFSTLEQRFGALEQRFTGLEGRMATIEARMTAMLAVLVNIARRIGVEDDS
jgi:hypothetical protein